MAHDRRRLRSGVLFCCSTVVFTALAFAQTQTQPSKGSAQIPFDFYVAGTKLPAGSYTLDLIAPTYVLLRNQDGKIQQDLYFVQSSLGTANLPHKIVFALRDGKYYFAEVWSIYGKAQLTSFTPLPNDPTKDVPLKTVEKTVAKP